MKSYDFKWHKAFSESRKSIEGEARFGRLSTSKTDDNMTKASPRRTVPRIASKLDLNYTTDHLISTEESEEKCVQRQFPKTCKSKRKKYA